MRALITGIRGFSGSHLARHLLACGYHVHGTDLPAATPGRLESMGVAAFVEVTDADVSDAPALRDVVTSTRPDVIYHLAGLSGRQALAELLRANVAATDHLLAAAAGLGSPTRVFLASSAGVYGPVPAAQQPIGEDHELAPVSPYALSKAAMEVLGWAHGRAPTLEVMVARPFNLVGPDMPEERLGGVVQRQLEAIRRGRRPPVVEVGNLDAVRDLVDVDVAVRCYRAIAVSGEPGRPYNVCSGKGTTMRDYVQGLIDASGLGQVGIEEDRSRQRSDDLDVSIGDGRLLADLMQGAYPYRE